MADIQSIPCDAVNCLAPNSRAGKRHDWHHHVCPTPFHLDGLALCFRFEGGRLTCPFPSCSASTNRRDRATKHMRDAHGLGEGVHIFDGPAGKSAW